MTNVTIIGQKTTSNKKYKHIKFVHVLLSNMRVTEDYTIHTKPSAWDNIELISKGYGIPDGSKEPMDLMFAYDNPGRIHETMEECRKNGTLYIGYFNEGLV